MIITDKGVISFKFIVKYAQGGHYFHILPKLHRLWF